MNFSGFASDCSGF